LRGRVKLLLSRHPEWMVVLVEGLHNKAADHLSRRAFRTEDQAPARGTTSAGSAKKRDWHRRG
jgi:hypothetical protein